jgi:hypothetical protein
MDILRVDAPLLVCSRVPILNLSPSRMRHLLCAHGSAEQVIRLGQGILTRPRSLATAGFLLQPCQSLR